MDLRPFNVKNHRVKHLFHSGSVGSTSATAAGTGAAMIPVYFWCTASAIATLTCFNGTSGSTLFTIKTTTHGAIDGSFWDDAILPNKALVIEAEGTPGICEFHVWYVVRRIGAGGGGTTL